MKSLKTIFLIIVCLTASCKLFAKPKDYQNILMNEPVSLLDFMIYQARRDLDKFVKAYMLERSPSSGLAYRLLHYDLSVKDDDWVHIKQPLSKFLPPLKFRRVDLSYDFKNGTFDVEVSFRWDWIPQMVIHQNISHKLEETKRNGVLALNQKTIAKLCEQAIKDLETFYIVAIVHEGYTNSRLKKIEGELQQKINIDTRRKVNIHVNGSLPSGDLTDMTCDTVGYDYPPKINYSYKGNWHELDEIIERRISR